MNGPYPVSAKDPLHPGTPFAKTPRHGRDEHAEYRRGRCAQRPTHRRNSFEVLASTDPLGPATLKPRLALAGWPLPLYPAPTAVARALLQYDSDPLAADSAEAGLFEAVVP